jgi:hypothetical protein
MSRLLIAFLLIGLISLFLLPLAIADPDTDQDGLTDEEEIYTYFTNPLLWDTDGDDCSDGEEVGQGTDPLDSESYSACCGGGGPYPNQ